MSAKRKNDSRDDVLERAHAVERLTRAFGHNINPAEIVIGVDEGITALFEAQKRGEHIASPLAYVCKAGSRYLIKALRRREHELSMSEVLTQMERNGLAEWEPDANDSAERARDARDDVRYLFSQLPKAWRQAMELFDIQEYSIDEIAATMKRTPKAIRRLLEKARERFTEVGMRQLGYPPPQQESCQSKQK